MDRFKISRRFLKLDFILEKLVKLLEVKKFDELAEFLCCINLTKKIMMRSPALADSVLCRLISGTGTVCGPVCCDGFKRREFTYWGGLYASFAHALIFEVSVASLWMDNESVIR